MNVLFMSLTGISCISDRGIYSDLIRKFRDEGHHVYMVKPVERHLHKSTSLENVDGINLLNVKTFNTRSTNIAEKGLSILSIGFLFKKAINKFFRDVEIDLILYSTPPITFVNVVKYLKKENPRAVSYLLLKDIFPQNAVDLGMIKERSLLNWYFRHKEKNLYKVSNYIGCMSPENVKFVLEHNSEVAPEKVEIAPNSIELKSYTDTEDDVEREQAERLYIRKKYDLPTGVPIFIYGGNLGKPQGVDYLIKCLEAVSYRFDCYFMIVGSGTEFHKLDRWYQRYTDRTDDNSQAKLSVKLMRSLPKEDYDMLVRHCDVGLIFLDHRFTIPNYPSRLLSYLENKIPVICATDVNTDIGLIAEQNGYGYWCESAKPEDFVALVDKMLTSDMKAMGEKGYKFLCKNYLVEHTYNAIMKHFE